MSHAAEFEQRLRKAETTSGGPGGAVAWADITGKPSTFPPSPHTHAGIPVAGALIVTVPTLALDHAQTVAAAGVTAGMRVLLSVAPHADADENHETMLDLTAMAGEAGTDQITVRMGFASQTSGAIRLNFMAV